jgi:transcriptional regulator with XRE-family HTH domain
MSQEDLAGRLGVDRKTVARWESGTSRPHPWQRNSLARALQLTLDELDQHLEAKAAGGLAASRDQPPAPAPRTGPSSEQQILRESDSQVGSRLDPALELRLSREGDIVAEVNRRTVLVASAAALAYITDNPADGSLIPARPSLSDDPFGFAHIVSQRWPDVDVVKPTTARGSADWQVLLPGGRSMRGVDLCVQLHPARMSGTKAVLALPDTRKADDFLRRNGRGLVVGAVTEGDEPRFLLLDARQARSCVQSSAGSYELAVPDVYELDDLTYGILWAVANLDDALLADDQLLHEARHDLKSYEQLTASAVSRESAPDLNPIAHMYLGSDFCARYILRRMPELQDKPVAWTKEQRGEEASTWLLFDHKYTYLRDTVAMAGGSMDRGFCIPEAAVIGSPKHERILLFLAMALMESLGIHIQLTTDSSYETVEGFVLVPHTQEAVIANWVGGEGMWHVDLTSKSTVVRQFEEVVGDVGAQSHIEAVSPVRRLQGLADYLDLDWAWLVRRCGQLGYRGTARLIQSRSRLVSPTGLDMACQYVGSLQLATA